ncbi:MAG: glycosyltransferase, partial [Burkholderiales bacterium]
MFSDAVMPDLPRQAAPICYQINLQRSLGGGEIYTRFFSDALLASGWEYKLVVVRGAIFWRELGLDPRRMVEITDGAQLPSVLPDKSCLVVTHNVIGEDLAREIGQRHTLAGVLHMPLYERDLIGLHYYDQLFAVSGHVLSSMRTKGLTNAYPAPIYAVADIASRDASRDSEIVKRSRYDWDRRKWRDRLFSVLEPLQRLLASKQAYAKRPGLTLGIVSRLTPIKQFPLLSSILVPHLVRLPNVNLEIFGNGGYASVRDLRKALAPLGDRVRFWGHQSNVRLAYESVDFILSGLPEKEALGLNLIEAQACGTPVIAIDAPPFNETVLDGVSGYLYADPRKDDGAAFAALMQRLLAGEARLRPLDAAAHLQRFSVAAFNQRVARALPTY